MGCKSYGLDVIAEKDISYGKDQDSQQNFVIFWLGHGKMEVWVVIFWCLE
jgi:hypothetical protein